MKKLVFILLSILLPVAATAQQVVYDLNFEYNFDNREYDNSSEYYSKSMTINGARLTPMVGLDLGEGKLDHRLMLGIDVVKDMGKHDEDSYTGDDENDELLREIVFFYNMKTELGNGVFDLTGGVIPRRMIKGFGEDSQEFLSDSLRWFDRNIDGILLKYNTPTAFFEAGCDWNGMFGQKRREEIEIFGDFDISLGEKFGVGWKFHLHHYANSQEVSGVMDDCLTEIYGDFNLRRLRFLDEFKLRLAWLQSFQQDRRNDSGIIYPRGAMFEMYGLYRSIGFNNRFFFGTDMMPFYNQRDAAGNKYGPRLYWGDPFYRIHAEGPWNHFGGYERVEVFWEPHISKYVSIKCSVICHFCQFKGFSFAGWQQKFSLVFDLPGNLFKSKRR